MALPTELRSVLTKNGGTITTAQANTVGVYVLPDEFVDKMYAVQMRRPEAIYSHETALFLQDLTDRDPR